MLQNRGSFEREGHGHGQKLRMAEDVTPPVSPQNFLSLSYFLLYSFNLQVVDSENFIVRRRYQERRDSYMRVYTPNRWPFVTSLSYTMNL